MFITIFWILSFAVWEMTLRAALSTQFFSQYLLMTLCFVGVYGGVFAFITRLLPRKYIRRFMLVTHSIFTLLYASQLVYFRIFKVLYAVDSVKKGGQVLEFFRDILIQTFKSLPMIFVIALPLLALAIGPVWRKLWPILRPKPIKRVVNIFMPLIVAAYCGIPLFIGIVFGPMTANSPRQLLTQANVPVVAADRVGVLTAMLRDATAKRGDAGGSSLILEDPAVTDEVNPSGQTAAPGTETTAPQTTDANGAVIVQPSAAATPTPEPAFKPQPQILEWLDFKKLAEEETDENFKDMDLYFAQADPSLTNEKTGIYKGYNFIFITAEAFSRFVPDPELTPTLWHMQENGYKFTNFYNPVWAVSTLDGEYSGLLGTIPKGGVWSMYRSSDNAMDYAPGNLFRRHNYTTFAYHNHTWDYYDRDLSHPNLGYEYKGLGHGLDVKATWPESDLEMMELSVDDWINKEPFHAYYLTVSGHMYYTFSGNMMASKHRDEVANLNLSEEAKAYMACNMELDRAMEYLLKRLREAGIADRTVIALNADHYPYGLDKKTIDELAGETVEENFELYRGTFILYVDGMKPEIVDKPACSLDCIATCYNMLGMPYDSRTLSGRDIFSPTESLCMFMNRSWITDQGRYNALTGEFTPHFSLNNIAAKYPDYGAKEKLLADQIAKDPDEYVKKINNKVSNRFAIAADILDYDYYQYLRDKGYGPRDGSN